MAPLWRLMPGNEHTSRAKASMQGSHIVEEGQGLPNNLLHRENMHESIGEV